MSPAVPCVRLTSRAHGALRAVLPLFVDRTRGPAPWTVAAQLDPSPLLDPSPHPDPSPLRSRRPARRPAAPPPRWALTWEEAGTTEVLPPEQDQSTSVPAAAPHWPPAGGPQCPIRVGSLHPGATGAPPPTPRCSEVTLPGLPAFYEVRTDSIRRLLPRHPPPQTQRRRMGGGLLAELLTSCCLRKGGAKRGAALPRPGHLRLRGSPAPAGPPAPTA